MKKKLLVLLSVLLVAVLLTGCGQKAPDATATPEAAVATDAPADSTEDAPADTTDEAPAETTGG